MTDYTIPRANAPIAGTEPPSTQWYNFIRYLDSRSSSATGDVQAEITVIAEKLGSPDGTVDNIPPLSNVTSVQGKQSIASSGIGVVQLRLVNDATSPSAVSFYGTDSAGVKGWNLLYDAFADTDNIFKNNTDGIVSFDLTDLADSGTGALLATTFDAKGRKTGTKAATITGTAGRVTVANGDAIAGLPTIDLDTLTDAGGGVLRGITRDAYGRLSGTHAVTITGTANQVVVTGGTGSGASIALSAPQDIAATSTPSFAQVALSADPTTALQAATKQYVDSVAAGLSPKAPALLATTTNDTLTGLAARDGITPIAGSRVLVKNQTLPAQNGIYIASASAWARATDMATWAQVPSAYLWVEEGTVNADTGWVCTSDPSGVIGVTSITFVQFGGNGTVTAGAGITVSGNQVSLGTPSTLTGATTNSATGTTHTHALTLTKSDVGLGNVDNTSDANKPVSTAQQAALDLKLATATPSGYIDGLQMVWNSATSISATSGTCYIQGSSAVIAFPSLLTLSGLSLSASTWYHLYAYLNAGTPAIELVTTAPASPYSGTARSKTGDISRRYIGSVLTDSSSNIINFAQIDNAIIYKGTFFRVLSAGSAASSTAIDCSSCASATALAGIFIAQINVNSGSSNPSAYFTPADITASAGSKTLVCACPALSGVLNFGIVSGVCDFDSSRRVNYVVSGGSVGSGGAYLDLKGYQYSR